MTEGDVAQVLARYQSTVTEEPTPVLDELILSAARRRAVRVRAMRRSVMVFAVAAWVVWPFWPPHAVQFTRAGDESGYGRLEGATRYYLLHVAGAPYTGPGSMEQTQ